MCIRSPCLIRGNAKKDLYLDFINIQCGKFMIEKIFLLENPIWQLNWTVENLTTLVNYGIEYCFTQLQCLVALPYEEPYLLDGTPVKSSSKRLAKNCYSDSENDNDSAVTNFNNSAMSIEFTRE